MLVNPSGLDGHAMPIDLNIEHLIGDLKVSTSICLEGTSIRPNPRANDIYRHCSRQKGSMQIGIVLGIFLHAPTTYKP